MRNRALLLASSNPEDLDFLRRLLSPMGWEIRTAASCEEARRCLEQSPAEVMICERDLPDQGWSQLCNPPPGAPAPPVFIVASDCADVPLWASVLTRGGFDILARPFLGSEVTRVAEAAWREWTRRHRKPQPVQGPAAVEP
jgi:DNA-binding NtrC family response regulator